MSDFTERTELLIGAEGVRSLAASHVLVIGIGGVGSNCVEGLARGGIGSLTLVDYDAVSESNINRQAIALHSTIGRPKIQVAVERVADINPDARIETISQQVLPDSVFDLLEQVSHWQKIDYCIDTADLVTVKVALAAECAARDIPYLAAVGSGNKLKPELIELSDIYDTKVCRMCKAIRKRARKEGLQNMQVLYSPEEPLVIQADDATRKARSNIGTISYYPAIMGQLAASHCIRQLLS